MVNCFACNNEINSVYDDNVFKKDILNKKNPEKWYFHTIYFCDENCYNKKIPQTNMSICKNCFSPIKNNTDGEPDSKLSFNCKYKINDYDICFHKINICSDVCKLKYINNNMCKGCGCVNKELHTTEYGYSLCDDKLIIPNCNEYVTGNYNCNICNNTCNVSVTKCHILIDDNVDKSKYICNTCYMCNCVPIGKTKNFNDKLKNWNYIFNYSQNYDVAKLLCERIDNTTINSNLSVFCKFICNHCNRVGLVNDGLYIHDNKNMCRSCIVSFPII